MKRFRFRGWDAAAVDEDTRSQDRKKKKEEGKGDRFIFYECPLFRFPSNLGYLRLDLIVESSKI